MQNNVTGANPSFWLATLICIFVCWFTKLISCAMQQKLFGESMSGIVGRVAATPGCQMTLHGPYWLSSIEPCFDRGKRTA
jgi:Kef-type K+ transport system membrane component KefB